MAEYTRTGREKTRSANVAKRVRKTSATQHNAAQINEAQPVSPVEILRRAEEELHAGMYHEALLDADGCIRRWGADDKSLFIRGISRLKYGIPQLFELGMADLEQASMLGNDEASQLLQRMGGALAG